MKKVSIIIFLLLLFGASIQASSTPEASSTKENSTKSFIKRHIGKLIVGASIVSIVGYLLIKNIKKTNNKQGDNKADQKSNEGILHLKTLSSEQENLVFAVLNKDKITHQDLVSLFANGIDPFLLQEKKDYKLLKEQIDGFMLSPSKKQALRLIYGSRNLKLIERPVDDVLIAYIRHLMWILFPKSAWDIVGIDQRNIARAEEEEAHYFPNEYILYVKAKNAMEQLLYTLVYDEEEAMSGYYIDFDTQLRAKNFEQFRNCIEKLASETIA